jgi:hypothetical protein
LLAAVQVQEPTINLVSIWKVLPDYFVPSNLHKIQSQNENPHNSKLIKFNALSNLISNFFWGKLILTLFRLAIKTSSIQGDDWLISWLDQKLMV